MTAPIDWNPAIGRIDREMAPGLKGGAGEDGAGVSFKDMLNGLVNQVDALQKDADASIKELAAGKATDIHDVTVKMQEAGVAFELMMEVRNKLLEAYQQIVKMQ